MSMRQFGLSLALLTSDSSLNSKCHTAGCWPGHDMTCRGRQDDACVRVNQNSYLQNYIFIQIGQDEKTICVEHWGRDLLTMIFIENVNCLMSFKLSNLILMQDKRNIKVPKNPILRNIKFPKDIQIQSVCPSPSPLSGLKRMCPEYLELVNPTTSHSNVLTRDWWHSLKAIKRVFYICNQKQFIFYRVVNKDHKRLLSVKLERLIVDWADWDFAECFFQPRL